VRRRTFIPAVSHYRRVPCSAVATSCSGSTPVYHRLFHYRYSHCLVGVVWWRRPVVRMLLVLPCSTARPSWRVAGVFCKRCDLLSSKLAKVHILFHWCPLCTRLEGFLRAVNRTYLHAPSHIHRCPTAAPSASVCTNTCLHFFTCSCHLPVAVLIPSSPFLFHAGLLGLVVVCAGHDETVGA